MGDDAQQESLSAQVTPRTAQYLAELVRTQIAEEHERRRAQMEEILATAGQPAPPPASLRRKPKRERPDWLRVIPGGMAAFAPAAFLRAHVRHLVIGTAATAVLTGSSCLSPDMMQNAPAAQVPGMHAVAHHHHRALPVLPPVVPAARKRRRGSSGPAVKPGATRAPAPSPSPGATTPQPSPTAQDPSPLPTIPVPSPPVPTCLDWDGHHCDTHAPAGDLAGALGGLLPATMAGHASGGIMGP